MITQEGCQKKNEAGGQAHIVLRMLSSPIRKCILTDQYLPSDFLIRLAPMRVPQSRLVQNPRLARVSQTLIPDGLEHTLFKTRKSGRAAYILCWKEAISQMFERESYNRIMHKLTLHSLLGQQIAHLLRVRVLQELELLTEELEARPQLSHHTPVIRRLTREEWKIFKTTGIIPYPSAIAVLVVPPPNRNPITKRRPEPSMSSLPLEVPLLESSIISDDPASPKSDMLSATRRPLPSLSTLHPTSSEIINPNLPDLLPHSLTPLYNGLTLFPFPPQRAALHALLSRLLFLERRARYRDHPPPDEGKTHVEDSDVKDRWTRGDEKSSHTFLLCADAEIVKRADVAAVAMALWRVRMFEGVGWGSESTGGWVRSTSRKRRL